MRFSLLFNGQNKYIFFSFSKYICSFFLIAFLLSILLVLSLAGQLCLPGHPLIGADAKNARNSGQPLVDSTSCRQSTKDPPRIQNNIIQQWMLEQRQGCKPSTMSTSLPDLQSITLQSSKDCIGLCDQNEQI